MNDIFAKTYLNIINEDVNAVGDEYTSLIKQVVAEQEYYDKQVEQAAEELLIGFRKVNKEGFEALERKVSELRNTPAFMEEYEEIVGPLFRGELSIKPENWARLQLDFSKMAMNPNHDERREFMFKARKFLKSVPASTVVKLNEMEKQLRSLVNKYSQF